MRPDAIIVRAGRLEQGMTVRPLDRPGAGWGELADAPLPSNSHVCLRYADGAFHTAHASTLYVVLVDSEAP